MINGVYLESKTQEKIKKIFTKKKLLRNISLHQFFGSESLDKINKEIKELSFSHQKIPLKHSYAISSSPQLQLMLSDAEIISVLSIITAARLSSIAFSICKFSWKDYIILHDEQQLQPGIDFIFNFSEIWNSRWGGTLYYSNGRETIALPHTYNTLTIIERGEKSKKFIKYINHGSENHSLILAWGSVLKTSK